MRRDNVGELEIYAPGMSASSQAKDKATGLKVLSLSDATCLVMPFSRSHETA